jgi:acid phosphatase family membrane protein YuiD
MSELFANRVFQATCLVWGTAQILKFVIELIYRRRVNFRLLTTAGGMPS